MKNHTKSSEKDSGINEYVDQKEDEVIPPMIALYGSVDEIDFTLDTSYNDNNVKSQKPTDGQIPLHTIKQEKEDTI